MKYIAILILLAACGGADNLTDTSDPLVPNYCDQSPYIGQYDDVATGDFVNIYDDCTGDTIVCGYDFEFTVTPGSNNTTLTVISNDGSAGCMTVGDHQCYVDFHPTTGKLRLDCTGYPLVSWDPV